MNSNEMDFYDFEENVTSSVYTFDNFKSDHPTYLDDLNNYIALIYNTYVLLHTRRFGKILKNPEYTEIANKCGFGMLLRHAMETLVTSIATEKGIEVGGRSVFERLSALKGQNIEGFDSEKKQVLSKLLDLTNEIAHPHVIHKNSPDFAKLKSFYTDSFKSVLGAHISYIEKTVAQSKESGVKVIKEVARSRKQSLKYLLELKSQLDDFKFSSRSTGILIEGCLVRQLTECTANLWCYNYSIVPTDASTYENQINLGKVLNSLSYISKGAQKNAFGISALTTQVVSDLFDLKDASNSLMHVDKFAHGDLKKQGSELSKLYKVVKDECAPHVMKKKLSEAASLKSSPKKKFREKSPVIATLLCGVTGWLGTHHFYVGKYIKGIIYILFGGFIIGPLLDLNKISKGRFRDSRGFRLKRTPLASLLATLFILLHLVLLYFGITKFAKSDFVKNIEDFNLLQVISMEKIDEINPEEFTKIKIEDVTASSHLETSSASYDATLCTDGKKSTCWQDGVDGNGEGQILTFTFEKEEEIYAIAITNGKQKNEKSYYDNARASVISVKADGLPSVINLDDTMEKQIFRFSKPKTANEISLIIVSAYSGDKWEDLCLSEVEFLKMSSEKTIAVEEK